MNSLQVQANFEKEKTAAASVPTDVEAIVSQRLEVAATQAKAEREAAVNAAIAPLQEQISTLSQGQPDLAQLQERHAAEIRKLQEQLAAAASASPTGVSDEVIEARVNEKIAALQAEHAAAVARATESGRMEGEAKLKMLQMQFSRVRNELNQLKAAQTSGVAAAPTPGVPSPANVAQPATPVTAVGGGPTSPASPTVARGRGRGVPANRGAVPKGRGAAPGMGRGSVLDQVNQTIAGVSSPQSGTGQFSILGASGQKRTRDEEETADPGSLAKRMKPGEIASLPPKPTGRGGAPPLNRGRIAGTPPTNPPA